MIWFPSKVQVRRAFHRFVPVLSNPHYLPSVVVVVVVGTSSFTSEADTGFRLNKERKTNCFLHIYFLRTKFSMFTVSIFDETNLNCLKTTLAGGGGVHTVLNLILQSNYNSLINGLPSCRGLTRGKSFLCQAISLFFNFCQREKNSQDTHSNVLLTDFKYAKKHLQI